MNSGRKSAKKGICDLENKVEELSQNKELLIECIKEKLKKMEDKS